MIEQQAIPSDVATERGDKQRGRPKLSRPGTGLAVTLAAFYSFSIVGSLANFVGGDGFREFGETSAPVFRGGPDSSLRGWADSVEPWFAINYLGILIIPLAAFAWWRYGEENLWVRRVSVFILLAMTLVHAYSMIFGWIIYPDLSP